VKLKFLLSSANAVVISGGLEKLQKSQRFAQSVKVLIGILPEKRSLLKDWLKKH